jgi:hypothetical protein
MGRTGLGNRETGFLVKRGLAFYFEIHNIVIISSLIIIN